MGWQESTVPANGAPPASSAPLVAAEEAHADALLASHSDPSSDLGRNAKFGCIAIAAGVVLLVLFLLFGLPKLLYKKNGDSGAPSQEQVRP